MRTKALLLLLLLALPALAGEALSVVVLGPTGATPIPRPGQGPLAPRPLPGSELPRTPPGLVVLVDGKARVLVDPGPGTLAAARAASVDLAGVTAVLLTSTRPLATSEIPVLLTSAEGPPGALRLVGPGAVAPWPSVTRWVEVLFGPSGVYRAGRSAQHFPRVDVDEVRGATERRSLLPGDVELRARATPEGAAFRLSRGGVGLVLAGEAGAGSLSALQPLASGAGLLVAGIGSEASARALAELGRGARVRALLVVSVADAARASIGSQRELLAGAFAEVTLASSGPHPVTPAAASAAPRPGGCQTDDECGPGKLCMGCGGDAPRECVAGCRSKADCGPGRACVQVDCVRCPCPAQCVGP